MNRSVSVFQSSQILLDFVLRMGSNPICIADPWDHRHALLATLPSANTSVFSAKQGGGLLGPLMLNPSA